MAAEMPKTDFTGPEPEREFWRDLKPIEQVFRPGSLPEAYIANAPTETTATTSRSPTPSAVVHCGSPRARTGGATC